MKLTKGEKIKVALKKYYETHHNASYIELKDILVEHSKYNRGHLKRRLIKEQLLINRCYICNIDPIWNDKPLILILDHINGVHDDNRLFNLRLLCPNCNSQTNTFTGKNMKICRIKRQKNPG